MTHQISMIFRTNATVKSDYTVYIVGKFIAMFFLIIWLLTYLNCQEKVIKGPDKNADHVEEGFSIVNAHLKWL